MYFLKFFYWKCVSTTVVSFFVNFYISIYCLFWPFQTSAVKSKLQSFGLQVHTFQDQRLTYYTKYLRQAQPFLAKLPVIIDFKIFKDIVNTCDTFPPLFFKAIYLVAFYSFLRISNHVPHSMSTFSPLEQLAKGNIFFAPLGLHILIKWPKTLQNRNKVVIC